jgi:hypothetical protein
VTLVNTWAKHFPSVWRERALETRIPNPLWYRIMCLAYGSHRRNGHASFAPGEIAQLLGVNGNRVSEAIADAKARDLIDKQSTSRCLVVPAHAINFGPGEANEPCGYCEGKRTGRKKPQIRRSVIRPAITPEAPELQPQPELETNVVALNPVPEPDCIGCKLFGLDGCNTHSPHWTKLREPVPA